MRDKYLSAPDSLAEYELLELLLTYSIPRCDLKGPAKRLIERFGGLAEVMGAEAEEIASVDKISTRTAVFLKLIHDVASRISFSRVRGEDVLQSPENVVSFARNKLASLKDEAFMIIFVNRKNKTESYEIVHEGTIDHVVIYPRNVVKMALRHNAAAMIAVHNHPSGDCEPSSHDIRLTRTLKDSAESIEVKLLDHIIISKTSHFSFVENGLL